MSIINEHGLNGLDTSVLVSQLEKAANPFRGTSYEAIYNAEQKFSQMADPFKNKILESLSEFNERFGLSINGTEKEGAFMRAQGLKTDQSNYFLTGRSMPRDIFPYPNPIFDDIQPDVFERINIYRNIEENRELSPSELSEPETKSSIIRIGDVIRIEKIIKSIYDDNEELYRVGYFDFEEVIAELLRKRGYIVELTKKTRDGGKDIIALHDLNGLGVNKYLVECKRNAKDRPVGVGVLRSLCYTVQREGANKGIIFTSSYFTKDAIQMQQKDHPSILGLQDGVDILYWIRTAVERKQY